MKDLWIKECGVAEEAALPQLLQKAAADCVFTAYFTDCAKAGYGKDLAAMAPNAATLLELRAFNAGQELWLHRTMVGQPFAWRIADDDTLAQNLAGEADDFLKQIENHRIAHTQVLDIDEAAEEPRDAAGCRVLHTTVGGRYALPITEKDKNIRLVTYLHYDENGIAAAADTRMAGFTEEEDAQ